MVGDKVVELSSLSTWTLKALNYLKGRLRYGHFRGGTKTLTFFERKILSVGAITPSFVNGSLQTWYQNLQLDLLNKYNLKDLEYLI